MRHTLIGLGFVLATAAPAAALGISTGYTLEIDGSTNVPVFQLTNDSTSATLDSFSFSIGDTAYNFDYAQSIGADVGTMGFTLDTGDTLNGGARTDLLAFTLTGFDPGEVFGFETDIDPDNSNVTVDFRDVFFNNGAAPNSVISVAFSDGVTFEYTLPDAAELSSYTFSQSVSDVPLPAAAPLLGAGLAGLAFFARRRRG
ncbi:MAG: VPLPA-CTERM sorting domain-containing protein [Pseudomonadota bacterium]|nr:VPLPA-CTERM sorting domain-containing protein [Pseudomonadota bacterium]MEE3101415.1 VPLPA-CTERM sorting domain-containing protein [Pseudomonadota bacterium]